MMLTREQMGSKLSRAFSPEQSAALVEILDDIRQAELQRAADTRELKRALTGLTGEVRKVAELARAADTRELRQGLTRLTEEVCALAEAQRCTEVRVEELAAA